MKGRARRAHNAKMRAVRLRRGATSTTSGRAPGRLPAADSHRHDHAALARNEAREDPARKDAEALALDLRDAAEQLHDLYPEAYLFVEQEFGGPGALNDDQDEVAAWAEENPAQAEDFLESILLRLEHYTDKTPASDPDAKQEGGVA